MILFQVKGNLTLRVYMMAVYIVLRTSPQFHTQLVSRVPGEWCLWREQPLVQLVFAHKLSAYSVIFARRGEYDGCVLRTSLQFLTLSPVSLHFGASLSNFMEVTKASYQCAPLFFQEALSSLFIVSKSPFFTVVAVCLISACSASSNIVCLGQLSHWPQCAAMLCFSNGYLDGQAHSSSNCNHQFRMSYFKNALYAEYLGLKYSIVQYVYPLHHLQGDSHYE